VSSVYFHEESYPLLVPIEQVKPYENNANNGDVDVVRESILTNGFYGAVIAQAGTGTLIAGHTRYEALLSLGATRIPVIWVKVDDVSAARMRIVDNRSTRLGKDDQALLLEELQHIMEADNALLLVGTGYLEEDLESIRALLDGPLEFDETEFAKQRGSKTFECPACGWRADG
jgi:ParB family transcriptional regulator, chromosome partitioning protein